MFRVGMGFDVHRLVEGRELWLGGVNIPWEKGLLGHSDADVAIHALCDALLGAAALRDIGYHFPDTDPRYKGIDSRLLLKHVMKLVDEHGTVTVWVIVTSLSVPSNPNSIRIFPRCNMNWLAASGVSQAAFPSKQPRPSVLGIQGEAKVLRPMPSRFLKSNLNNHDD